MSRKALQPFRCSSQGMSMSAVGTITGTTADGVGGTIMGWTKVNSLNDTSVGVYMDDGVREAWRLNFEGTTGFPFIWTVNAAGTGTVLPKADTHGSVPINQFFHYAATFLRSGSTLTGQIYINGVLWGSQTLTRDVRAGSRFAITSSTRYKHCNTVVLERIATQAEIIAHMNGIIPATPALVWNSQEGAQDTRYDSSGNGRDGTGGTLTWFADVPPCSARKETNKNLIPNGDFSFVPPFNAIQTITNWMDGSNTGSSANNLSKWWFRSRTGSPTARFDNSQGFRAIKLSSTTGSDTWQIGSFDPVTQTLANMKLGGIVVRPSTTYILSVRVKANNLVANSFRPFAHTLFKIDGTAGSYDAVGNAYGGSIDTTLITTFTTGPNDYWLNIKPIMNIAGNVSDTWIGEVTLRPATPVTRTIAAPRVALRDFGTQLKFSGSDKVTTTGVLAAFGSTFPTNATISGWFKTRYVLQESLFALGSSASNNPLFLIDTGADAKGSLRFILRDISGGGSSIVTRSVNDGWWHHYVAIKQGTSMFLYLDGALSGTQTGVTLAATTFTSERIGVLTRSSDSFGWIGTMDEVRVFNRGLSAQEIATLYRTSSPPSDKLTSMVGEWLFNELSGNTAIDSSGHGNDGTITGAVRVSDPPMKVRKSG